MGDKPKEYYRAYYKNEENHKKRNLRAVVNARIRDGRIVRQPCSRCGEEKSEVHHEDYSKPFDITWLCKWCHSDRHMELKYNVKLTEFKKKKSPKDKVKFYDLAYKKDGKFIRLDKIEIISILPKTQRRPRKKD